MTKESYLDMMLKREPGHRKVRQTLQKNPGPMLLKTYDEETKKVRTKETDKKNSNNVRLRFVFMPRVFYTMSYSSLACPFSK